ncbi:hypothetical protein BBEV_2317 [Salisediminibacterium beveridgei]|uniref:Uncharacterized protein n=1 Tax=Salisediminibacterium beveridgei TaxID=632773 RepID=A0A1D7QXI4_9BACI|nr:hypothetical protein BBEV_2317 [Salisediminibacterium beveridgei]
MINYFTAKSYTFGLNSASISVISHKHFTDAPEIVLLFYSDILNQKFTMSR